MFTLLSQRDDPRWRKSTRVRTAHAKRNTPSDRRPVLDTGPRAPRFMRTMTSASSPMLARESARSHPSLACAPVCHSHSPPFLLPRPLSGLLIRTCVRIRLAQPLRDPCATHTHDARRRNEPIDEAQKSPTTPKLQPQPQPRSFGSNQTESNRSEQARTLRTPDFPQNTGDRPTLGSNSLLPPEHAPAKRQAGGKSIGWSRRSKPSTI